MIFKIKEVVKKEKCKLVLVGSARTHINKPNQYLIPSGVVLLLGLFAFYLQIINTVISNNTIKPLNIKQALYKNQNKLIVKSASVEEIEAVRLAGVRAKLSGYIAEKYFVNQEFANIVVDGVYKMSEKHKLSDPILFLSIIAIESRFNPMAESVVRAQGLTQVYAKYHQEKLEAIGGSNDINKLFMIDVNIEIGVKILKEYLSKFNNNEVLALLQYNGSLTDSTQSYAKKVLSVKKEFDQVISQE